MKTNSSPFKNDAWKTIRLPFKNGSFFQGLSYKFAWKSISPSCEDTRGPPKSDGTPISGPFDINRYQLHTPKPPDIPIRILRVNTCSACQCLKLIYLGSRFLNSPPQKKQGLVTGRLASWELTYALPLKMILLLPFGGICVSSLEGIQVWNSTLVN